MSGGYKRSYESENPSNSRSVRGRTDRMMIQQHEYAGLATSSSLRPPNSYVDERDPRINNGNPSASSRTQSPYNSSNHGHSDYRGHHGYPGRHGYHRRSDYHEREQSNTPSSYRSRNDRTGNRDSPGYREHRGYPSSSRRSDYSDNYIDDHFRHSDRNDRYRQENVRPNFQEPSASRNEGRNGSDNAYEQFSRERQDQPTTHFEGTSTATEAESVEKGQRPERSLITETLTTKPNYVNNEKHGKHGRQVTLLTNYFKILKEPSWQLYQYRVDFSPDVELRGLKNRLIYEQQNLFGRYLFDGTILVLMRKLEGDVSVVKSKDRDDNPIIITVKFTGVVSKNQYDFILNTILRKSISALELVLVRRNFFDPHNAITSFRNNFKLELWPGYITSIRQHENDILLCVEITTKVMRTETVLDILKNCYNDDEIDFKRQFESKVLGMIVLTDYNNKTHRITGVDYDSNASSTFDQKGVKTTFIEYYKKKYGITIKDKSQPLLISKGSDREVRGGRTLMIALIPEFCRPTGLSDKMRSNDGLMKSIANYTKLNPNARIDSLIGLNRRLQESAKSRNNFNEWNFKLDTDLVKVTGRCLQNEKIIFGNDRQITTDRNSAWSNEPHKNQMYVSQHLTNWTIIVPNSQKIAVSTNHFLELLKKTGNQMKYNISSPTYITLNYDDNASYVNALNEAANGNPQLIMCIVSDQQKDRYSVIKKKCCVERAIPSQVITSKTILRQHHQLMSIATKVVIQINSKLGGVPWMVNINHNDLMVVGYDICRDSKDTSKSFGAMVATMNMKLKQNFYSVVDVLTSGQQLSDNFGTNILKCATAYGQQHGKLPTKIVIYRCGVGEGQIKYLYEHEIKDIQDKLRNGYKDVPFQMSFFLVSKKINTRFFTTNKTNPSPGTVVDSVVTIPQRYEFFLVSQSPRQGTVSPTSYNILHDDMQFTPDQWQTLTYKLTHLYYNWFGTVSVPAVCQNAHRLAFLVANFIHDRPSNRLEKQLYFL